ncbi:UDP-glucose 6-dehydrogenase TuaD-like [Rhinoderma darwinii]|uniref:UDP-glucose 6-dehydrogenase TuaD-like n=1 Tax=Rhinoderma darwinii TaxID=43563 RepID=UPI003F67A744
MKISVIGTGYVGLVTGTCLAETGNEVICMDIDIHKVNSLREGKITIFEPGLENIFLKNIKEERLTFTTDIQQVVDHGDILFLALPTPPKADDSADLSYILKVADQLGHLIKTYKVIIDKSTVPVGTSEKVKEAITRNCKVEVDVISNPEFLREGFAVEDFLKPDRIVIGTSSERAVKLINEIYAPYVRQGNPIIFMDEKSAELTKYAANTFLAMKISFMNEIALLCEKVGADVDLVRRGIGTDERIGKRFLFPGIGYGGSCFPKDVKALHKTSKEYEYHFKILDAVMDVNKNQIKYFFNKIWNYYNQDIKGKTFALWGLAFKPNTDDIREAPALELIQLLINKGAKVNAYDPESMNNVKKILGTEKLLSLTENMYQALENADALIIATEWSEFRNPNWDRMDTALKSKTIFDGRNVFELNQMKAKNYTYFSIGR